MVISVFLQKQRACSRMRVFILYTLLTILVFVICAPDSEKDSRGKRKETSTSTLETSDFISRRRDKNLNSWEEKDKKTSKDSSKNSDDDDDGDDNELQEFCICVASGDPHYTSFDGDWINFQGQCKYDMVEYENEEDEICGGTKVQVKNEHVRNNMQVIGTRSVHVYGLNFHIYLGPKKNSVFDIQINGEPVSPSLLEEDYTLIISRGTVLLELTSCHVIIEWDGVYRVSVRVPAKWGERLTGICGNCNGDKSDTYMTPDGDLSFYDDKNARLGNYYSVKDDNDWELPTCAVEDVYGPCSSEGRALAESMKYCGILTASDGSFATILENPDIAEEAMLQMAACVFDVCHMLTLNESNADDTACRSVDNFVRTVQEKHGIDVLPYRTDSFCPFDCVENEEYSYTVGYEAQCGDDPENINDISFAPAPGCKCKDGYFRSNGACVSITQCGCRYQRKYYEVETEFMSSDCRSIQKCFPTPGGGRVVTVTPDLPRCPKNSECKPSKDGYQCQCLEDFVMNSEGQCEAPCGRDRKSCHINATCLNDVCRCKQGLKGDGIISCMDVCECRVSNDQHHWTFDGQDIPFTDSCIYTLTNVTKNDACGANVEIKGWRNETQQMALYRNIYVTLPDGDNITLVGGDVNTAMVNDIRQYGNIQGQLFQLEDQMNCLIIRTTCGITIRLDKRSSLTVWVPKNIIKDSAVEGICGDCNGSQDDLRTKNGTLIPVGTKGIYSIIGNSYLVPGDDREITESCTVKSEIPDCSEEDSAYLNTDSMCGVLFKDLGPFQTCTQFNADVYATAVEMLEECVHDACANLTKAADVVCRTIAAMTELCDGMGVEMAMEDSLFQACPEMEKKYECGETMTYDPEMTETQPSCQNPYLTIQELKGPVTKGCRCREGLLYDQGKCIPQSQCGCTTITGVYYPKGAKMTSPDCRYRTTCNHTNGLPRFEHASIPGCQDTEVCVPSQGDYACRPRPTPMAEPSPTHETASKLTNNPVTTGLIEESETNLLPITRDVVKAHLELLSSTVEEPAAKTVPSSAINTVTKHKLPQKPSVIKECLEPWDPKGTRYWGTQDHTTSGIRCQLWASLKPHFHQMRNRLQGEDRYCRNMGTKLMERPWCFTEDRNVRWEYCDNIPVCDQANMIPPLPVNRGCYDDTDKGENCYNTTASMIWWGESGRRCLAWTDKAYDQFNDSYCRNPYGLKDRPWCFIDSSRDWEYCNVAECYKPAPPPEELGSHCIVDEETQDCRTQTVLKGNCYYSYKFHGECAFTAVVDTTTGVARLHLNNNSIVKLKTTGPKNQYFGCADVNLGSDRLTISVNTCGWCLQQTVSRMLSSDGECPGK